MTVTAVTNCIYRGKIYLRGEQVNIDSADARLKFFKGQKAPPIAPEVEEKLPPLGKQK